MYNRNLYKIEIIFIPVLNFHKMPAVKTIILVTIHSFAPHQVR